MDCPNTEPMFTYRITQYLCPCCGNPVPEERVESNAYASGHCEKCAENLKKFVEFNYMLSDICVARYPDVNKIKYENYIIIRHKGKEKKISCLSSEWDTVINFMKLVKKLIK